jgi:hypothetical protein
VIEGLHIDVPANESSRHLEFRIHSDFQTFKLGTASVDGLSWQGGRP